jgi:hypothetical protein
MYVAEVYSNTTSGKRLLQRSRKVLTRGEFATAQEAYSFTDPYFRSGHPTQIFFVGYFPDHPVDAAHDDFLIVESIKDTVREYYGDEYDDFSWEDQHDAMVEAEQKKQEEIERRNSGVPF